MSILIKGMEMPKDGERPYWVVIHPDRTVEYNKYNDQGWQTSEAIPVSPHGRLIDADAYETLIRGLGNREYRRENGTICDAIKFLHPYYTPTIIEAEEDEA